MLINVQVAVPQAAREGVAEQIVKGELSAQEADQIKCCVDLGRCTLVHTDKGVTYYALDLQVPSEADIAALAKAFPGCEIVGAWDYATGLPLGMAFDEKGDPTGTPTYPFNLALHVALRPRAKTRDPLTGAVTLEIPATEPGDDHLWMGQSPRMYVWDLG